MSSLFLQHNMIGWYHLCSDSLLLWFVFSTKHFLLADMYSLDEYLNDHFCSSTNEIVSWIFYLYQPFPFTLYDLLEQTTPLYNFLRRHVKQKSLLLMSPLPTPDLPVPANEKLLAWVGDEILPRDSAKVL